MRARHRLDKRPVLFDRSRKHAHEHNAVALDLHDLCHSGVGLLVSDDDVSARFQSHLGAGVSDVAVGQSISVPSMKVEPQIPRRHGEKAIAHGPA